MANYVRVPAWVQEAALNAISTSETVIKLFTNTITPTSTMVPGDFTEAVGGGYAAVTLVSTAWVMDSTVPRAIVASEVTFAFTTALATDATVMGWVGLSSGSSICKFAKVLDAPFHPVNNGDKLVFTPKVMAGHATVALSSSI